MKRWSVRKRDGVWQVFDHRGKLRYAAADWGMAVSFALLCGKPLPDPWADGSFHIAVIEKMNKRIEAAMRRAGISPLTGMLRQPIDPRSGPPILQAMLKMGREDPAKYGFETADEFEAWFRGIFNKPKKDQGDE